MDDISDSAAVLRTAITVAHAQGVDRARVVEAAERLACMEEASQRREAAEEALLDAVEAAAGGDMAGVEALSTALRRAVEAGADDEVLEEARAVLRSREAFAALAAAEVRPTECDEAESALVLAANGDDSEVLVAAMAQARIAGVCDTTMAEAEEALSVLRELEKAKMDASESLAKAMVVGHGPLLEAAIALAEEAGVEKEALEAARVKLSAVLEAD